MINLSRCLEPKFLTSHSVSAKNTVPCSLNNVLQEHWYNKLTLLQLFLYIVLIWHQLILFTKRLLFIIFKVASLFYLILPLSVGQWPVRRTDKTE